MFQRTSGYEAKKLRTLQDQAALALDLNTGLRDKELRQIRWEQIDLIQKNAPVWGVPAGVVCVPFRDATRLTRDGGKISTTFAITRGWRWISFSPTAGRVWMVECKASRTVQPSMARPMEALRHSMGDRAPGRLSVVHRASSNPSMTHALAPGIEALPVDDFVQALAGRKKQKSSSSR